MIHIVVTDQFDRRKYISSYDEAEKRVIAAIRAAGYPHKVEKVEAGIWEEREVTLEYNYILSNGPFEVICEHAVHVATTTQPGNVVGQWYVNPLVIVAVNEGGHNTTGVCAGCLMKYLPKQLLEGKPNA